LADLLSTVVREAGSALEIDDRRADGTPQQFMLTPTQSPTSSTMTMGCWLRRPRWARP
jgi:hypothetical protein